MIWADRPSIPVGVASAAKARGHDCHTDYSQDKAQSEERHKIHTRCNYRTLHELFCFLVRGTMLVQVGSFARHCAQFVGGNFLKRVHCEIHLPAFDYVSFSYEPCARVFSVFVAYT